MAVHVGTCGKGGDYGADREHASPGEQRGWRIHHGAPPMTVRAGVAGLEKVAQGAALQLSTIWLDVWNSRARGNLRHPLQAGWEVRAHERLRRLGVESGSQVNAGTETTPETEGETHELLQQLKELYSV